MDTLLRDLRYGAKNLAKRPGFTFVVVLTLALGIGANAAIFSVVNGVLLSSLPYADADRIVTVWENNSREGIARDDVSPANFLDLRERQQSFFELAFANPNSLDYTGGDEPEVLRAASVSKGFFDVFGMAPAEGRTFLAEEYDPGKNQVVVLSYGTWERRFGGDRKLIGQPLTLDGQPMTVVGVMPRDFRLYLFDREEELWFPQVPSESMKQQRKATYLKVVGRLKPGVSRDQAQADLNNIAAQLSQEFPNTNQGIGMTAVTLPEHFKGAWRPALWILFGAVGLVLLIACANVANLFLARGAERQREFAIRSAIGAGRGRIIRQLLIENLLFAVLGSACGLVLAAWAVDVIVATNPGNIPRIEEVHLSVSTIAFTAVVASLATIIFGLAPALELSKSNLNSSLKELGQTTTAGVTRHRLRRALVVVQVGLAVVLLVGAGLLVRSFVRLLSVDPGFARTGVVAIQAFVWDRYRTPEQREAYAKETLERLEALPGVEAAGITTSIPLLESSQTSSVPYVVAGRAETAAGQEPVAQLTVASPNYFSAAGARLVAGRLFNQFDTAQSTRIVLVNQTMARRAWAGENPVGQKINLKRGSRDARGGSLEVVGVVTDQRQDGLENNPRDEMFIPYAQSPTGSLIFVVRTKTEPTALLPQLKAAIWQSNKTQPFYAVTTMDQLVDDALKMRRFNLTLLGGMAALALALAAVGIYGVMSFITRQRTHELGVRIALGAQARDILQLVVGEGLVLTLLGVAVGIIGSFALTRFLAALLFGVATTDLVTYVSISGLLTMVALLACYLPARRATQVDPLVALRHE